MTHLAEAGANPLLPNATFFVELIIFLIVLLVLWRFILPPIQKVLRDRHDMVQRTIEESRNAEVRFKEAEARYHEALAEARSEAGRIRDGARTDGQRVLTEQRERTNAEIAELRAGANEQLSAERERILADLQPQVRELAGALAAKVVGEPVAGGRRV